MRYFMLATMIGFLGLVSAPAAQAQDAGTAVMLVGCLVQEDDDGEPEFLLEGLVEGEVDASRIELAAGEGVNLAPHVGHLVTVDGVIVEDHDDDEDHEDEDAEGDEIHVRVDKLGHRAASCG